MDAPLIIHASCVALDGRGALILGQSGSGKSSLALEMMAFGADLIADDRVILEAADGLVASCPPPLHGLIEARGIGLLRAIPVESARICCAIDLDKTETDRLPPQRQITLAGQKVSLLYRQEGISLAPAILQYLKCGRSDL